MEKKNNLITEIIFLLLIFFILSFSVLNSIFSFIPELRTTTGPSTVKNRVVFNLKQLLNQGRVYYNPQYQLIRLNSLIKVFIFKSPSKINYFLGKNNWLFLAGSEKAAAKINNFRGLNHFTLHELETLLKPIQNRYEKLAAQGIEYYFVIVPVKFTAYPEYLPRGLAMINPTTKADQFVNFAVIHDAGHFIIDTRPAVIQAKSEHLVFYPYDSHWNDWGAFIGSREIIERAKVDIPSLKLLNINDFNVRTEYKKATADIAASVFIDKYYCDNELIVSPKTAYPAVQTRPAKKDAPTDTPINLITEVDDDSLPTAIFFCNSFLIRFRANFLAEQFKKAYFISNDYNHMELDYKLIDIVKPDVVIQQTNERYFFNY